MASNFQTQDPPSISGRLFLSFDDYVEKAKATSSIHLAYLLIGWIMSAVGVLFIMAFIFNIQNTSTKTWEFLIIFIFSIVLAILLSALTVSLYMYDPYEITQQSYRTRPWKLREKLEGPLITISFWLSIIVSVMYLVPLALYIYLYIADSTISIDGVHRMTFIFLLILSLVDITLIGVGVLFLIRRVELISSLGTGKQVIIELLQDPQMTDTGYIMFLHSQKKMF